MRSMQLEESATMLPKRLNQDGTTGLPPVIAVRNGWVPRDPVRSVEGVILAVLFLASLCLAALAWL